MFATRSRNRGWRFHSNCRDLYPQIRPGFTYDYVLILEHM